MGVAIVKGIFLFFLLCYLLVSFLLIKLLLRFSKKKWNRGIFIALFLLIYVGPFIKWAYDQNEEKRAEYKKTYPPAYALFKARCMMAGEKIYKTVENVEGILLLNLRRAGRYDYRNPYWPDAGLPREHTGDNYIRDFLDLEHRTTLQSVRHFSPQMDLNRDIKFLGYSYVDVMEGEKFVRYRYKEKGHGELLRESISSAELARYGVSFTNDVIPEDREHWVAGTTVTILDTLHQEILAEKTWYSFAITRAIEPNDMHSWSEARVCPEIPRSEEVSHQTRKFVDQVLKPKQEY